MRKKPTALRYWISHKPRLSRHGSRSSLDRFTQLTLAVLSAVVSWCAGSFVSAQELTSDELNFFESKIRPVLIKECYSCHSDQAGNVRGGLRLDTQALTHIGGASGPSVVPGDLDESLLISAIRYEGWEMPPKKQLSPEVIADFERWIEMGAPDPRVNETNEFQTAITEAEIEAARDEFWAYRPPVRHPLPDVQEKNWPANDIDYFVLSRLEQNDLRPAEDAESSKVLRRLCFDLVGLPPTPEQIDFFQKKWAQDEEEAIELVVDTLLSKEQFGERWGRHWLDVARYAESTGREVNFTYPHAWRYRDYVIDSFNQDKPFDEFIKEQIAGDLLPADSDEEWNENLIATTFLAVGPKNVNEPNRTQFRMDLIDEQIDATTRAFMGTSVSCARCHDHKFDPIPQTDYYALAGIFSNATTYFGNPPSKLGNVRLPQRKQNSSLIRLPVQDSPDFAPSYSRSEIAELEKQAEQVQEEMRQARGSDSLQKRLVAANRLSEISDKLAVIDSKGNAISYTMGVQEKTAPRNAKLLIRGEIDQQAQEVERGFPQVLCSTPVNLTRSESGRLELAEWIGSDQNTLASRVMVNRIWQKMIGNGIVASLDNFGSTGDAPSHPELLDNLAIEFVESGWSIKTMVKQIAMSRTYRISSAFDENAHQVDPSNSFVWRANPRRLDAEAIRDAMLHVSGDIEFERPEGSEVAKAGYSRVRNGVIGDGRSKVRKSVSAIIEAKREDMRNQFRERFANRGQARRSNGSPFQRGNRFGSGSSEGTSLKSRNELIAEATSKVEKELDMEDSTFRSVYLPLVRDETPRSLEVFDFADSNIITGQRESSNTPNQALYMMNNRFVQLRSEAFAKRVYESSPSTDKRIEYAFELALGRSPTKKELRSVQQFVTQYQSASTASRDRNTYARDDETISVMEAFCQALFSTAEFRIVD